MQAVVLLALLFTPAAALSSEERLNANPIRKVVTMLQVMEKKVAAEGAKAQELFENFECYCKNSGGTLQASIAAAEAKIPEVNSTIAESEAKLAQLEADIKKAKEDRAAAKAAMEEATAVREKEAAAFAKEKADADTNLGALKAAIAALEKGSYGFLQTGTAQFLRNMVVASNSLADYDRDELVSFLAGEQHGQYAPQSGEIIGILKQMYDTMGKGLAEAEAAEAAAIKAYEELMAAKEKEIKALTEAIEEKTVRVGELGMEIVELKEDLADTEKSLADDAKFLKDLEEGCATKKEEHEADMKLRAQELVALADTIKVLNDDDALELFKKTLPSASSFTQLKVTSASQRQQALDKISDAKRHSAGHRPELDFIALALQGKKMSFDKIIKMIDDMVVLLGKEQGDDDHKKEYCETQFDLSEDTVKELEHSIKNLKSSIATLEETIATLTSEIEALVAGIASLDKAVAEATENRKEEHEEFTELMATDLAAKELLEFAKNRLNKFYNPTIYKAPPSTTLTLEDRLYLEGGGSTPAPAPLGGIAETGIKAASFVQISAHSHGQVAPPPPPETAAAYTKQSSASTGVIAMIDMLIKDLSTEMTEAKVTEENSQKEYEQMMADSKAKRAEDSKSLTDDESAKAGAEADLTAKKEDLGSTSDKLMATEKYIADMHAECDWLLQYFDVRKEARAGEIDSLKKAKDVLSGADYSLVQLQTRNHNLRGVL